MSLIESIGCHFVPVGEHNSLYRDLEWRVSFVVSECIPVRSFNHVQFKVHCLLKIIKSKLLHEYQHPVTNEQLVTSYHMKTIMFWVIENTPANMWVATNIIRCVKICLVYFKHFCKSGYLPNYFIPKINLFQKHSGVVHKKTKILGILDKYSKAPVILVGQLSSFPTVNCMLSKLQLFSNNLRCTMTPLHLLQSMIDNYRLYSECEYILVMTMLVGSKYNFENFDETYANQNKSLYRKRRTVRNICLMKTHFDVAAGWSHLSTYYYVTEQYKMAKHLCTYVLHPISTAVVYCGSIIESRTLEIFMQKLEKGDFISKSSQTHDSNAC